MFDFKGYLIKFEFNLINSKTNKTRNKLNK